MLTAQTLVDDTLADCGIPRRDEVGAGHTHPAYQSLTTFKQQLYRRYQRAAHLDLLDNHLEQVSRYVETGGREGIGRLIVSMPPRHGKTLTTSIYYPAWHIGRNPDHRAMLVSYNTEYATRNGGRARSLLMAQGYQTVFPGVTLATDTQAKGAWNVAGYEGGVDAIGVRAGATGKGAHLLIIDDPIKNREEAESETIRERIWDGYNDDLYTRLEPGGAVIVMMTRWHEDDLIGRLLHNEADDWVELRLPALAEDNDPLGRSPGAALWEGRYPRTRLEHTKSRSTPYSWSSIWQQKPTPAEGGIFKRAWFEPAVPVVPEIVRRVRFWDLAMSEKTSADYTVGTLMGEAVDGHFYVLDVQRQQIEWGEVTPFLADVMLRDGPNVAQGIEEKGFMSRAIQNLNADPRLRGHQIWGYPKDTDKLTNALPFASRCGAGLVHLVVAHWNETWKSEICSFPRGANDDQVDSAAGAYLMLAEGDGANYGSVVHEDDTTIGGF